MLFLNEHDLMQCLDLDILRTYMKDALLSFSLRQALHFPRVVFQTATEHNAPLGFMPAVDPHNKILGYKAITVFHHNKEKNLNPHQGIVTLLDSQTGKVKCILDGFFITAVRTAAVSAVATDLLSNVEAKTLAIIGSGCQAIAHVKAISRIRPIQNIRIYSRTNTSFNVFCEQFKNDGYLISHHMSPQEAVTEADIVVTSTPAKQSLLSIKDVPQGCHVNAIGACRPGDKEITIHDRSSLKIYLDSEEACYIESDEIIHPLQDLTLSKNTIVGELGSCLAEQIPARESLDEITFFKSVGLSIEDLYAADFFYKQAKKLNIGQWVNL